MNHLHKKKLRIFVLHLNRWFQVFSLITNIYILLDQFCSSFTMNFSTDLQFVNLSYKDHSIIAIKRQGKESLLLLPSMDVPRPLFRYVDRDKHIQGVLKSSHFYM